MVNVYQTSIGCRPGGGFLLDKQRQKRMAERFHLSSYDKKVKNIAESDVVVATWRCTRAKIHKTNEIEQFHHQGLTCLSALY